MLKIVEISTKISASAEIFCFLRKLVYNQRALTNVNVDNNKLSLFIDQGANITMKSLKRPVKNLILCILIASELFMCSFISADIFEITAERNKQETLDYVSFQISSVSAVPAAAAIPVYPMYVENTRWKGPVLTKSRGTIMGPSGKETYYNLNMDGVVRIMRRMGNNDEYWVREDGVKMLGDYVMVAANLDIRPRGSLVETSLGMGIVCDTGTFAKRNPYQLDIAVSW